MSFSSHYSSKFLLLFSLSLSLFLEYWLTFIHANEGLLWQAYFNHRMWRRCAHSWSYFQRKLKRHLKVQLIYESCCQIFLPFPHFFMNYMIVMDIVTVFWYISLSRFLANISRNAQSSLQIISVWFVTWLFCCYSKYLEPYSM